MKFLTGFGICLLFCATAIAQEEPEAAPTQEPSNSVVDPNLTVDAQADVNTLVTPDSEIDLSAPQVTDSTMLMDSSLQQAMPIQSTMPAGQAGCGCQQTNYQAATPMISQPYTYQVYSGNSFSRAPMQQYGAYQTYRMPQANVYTSTAPQYQQQYYYAPQPLVPVRRGLLFNRFRR